MSQNKASKWTIPHGTERETAHKKTAETVSPPLSAEREAIIHELTMVDIRDNHTANSEKDEKMLNWTINEIRKTCGNLPSEKLKKLVDSIKIVIKQRDVYLSKIEQELKTKREQLRKELDHENIDVKTASAGDIFIQKIKEYPDMLKIPMDQYAKINEMKQNDRESFIKKLWQDSIALSKFAKAWSNTSWSSKLEKSNPSVYILFQNAFDELSKKYSGILLDKHESLEAFSDAIRMNQIKQETTERDLQELNKIGKRLWDGELQKLNSKIKKLTGWWTSYDIQSVTKELCNEIVMVQSTPDYKELGKLAKSGNPEAIARKRIFDNMLTDLYARSKSIWAATISELWFAMFFDSKKKNRLEELTTRLDAAIQGVKTGKDLVLYYSAEEGNTAKSLSDFEADIRSKIEAGGPQNVNARGFADYLKKLHAQIPSKLTYAYLKEKGFLTQFGIHWKINTGEKNSTKTQEILSKEDPKALEAFKKVIQTHLDTTFILEKIKNGSAFEGMEKYLASQKVPNDKIQVVLQLLKKPGNGEANSIYMALLAMKLPSEVTEEELQKISELAAQWYESMWKAADAESNGARKEKIWNFLKLLSSPTLRLRMETDIQKIISESGEDSKLSLDSNFETLNRFPGALEKISKLISKYAHHRNFMNDSEILNQLLTSMHLYDCYKTASTISNNKTVRNEIVWKLKNVKLGENMGETQRNLETSPDMAEVKQNIGKVVAITVTAEQKRQELAETALLFDKIIFEKIITGMGMDPKITKELLISDRGLRIAFLKQISHVHPNLSPKERKYLYQLVHEINISIEEEQRTLEVFGKYNPDQYQQEVRDELKINHPKLANKIEIEEGVQRKPTIERTTENESREAQKWASNYQLNYRTGQTFDAQSISQMQVGKPIKMSEDTTIVLRKNGSCTVVTPYSKETIPPEKANIAIGFISVAKIFPGLDFMDGLHEALQSYSTNPLLSKMKDGCSKREECNLIKHYAELLGIAGFNENADTPDALVQSIKNCIPLGESFTGLARKKWLLRPDGRINPRELGNSFRQSTDNVAVIKTKEA